jgi:hypothetical protein
MVTTFENRTAQKVEAEARAGKEKMRFAECLPISKTCFPT